MDFKELITDFAARHGVDGLAAEDDAAAIGIDGISVALVAANGQLAATAEIGEPPADGAATFADLLLEANLASEVFFAKTPETGKYVAVRHLPLTALDPDSFDAALESLVNLAETWRRLLADFRPAAAQAAAETAEPPAFGNGGFIPV